MCVQTFGPHICYIRDVCLRRPYFFFFFFFFPDARVESFWWLWGCDSPRVVSVRPPIAPPPARRTYLDPVWSACTSRNPLSQVRDSIVPEAYRYPASHMYQPSSLALRVAVFKSLLLLCQDTRRTRRVQAADDFAAEDSADEDSDDTHSIISVGSYQRR